MRGRAENATASGARTVPAERREGRSRSRARPSVRRDAQLTLSAVSSRTNDVWSVEPSTPVNLIVTVCPA